MEPPLETLFLELLHTQKERLYRICQAYARNHEEAQDLFQETVLQIWKSLPTFRGQAQVQTWAYRITLNVCLQARHKIKREQKQTRPLDSIQFANLPATPPEPEQEAQLQALRACIQKLPETDRSLVLLYLEDLPYKEIAAVTGLTENHVAVKMKRIREKLFTCLQPTLC
ncbi:RNA polymerase sigma factor [Rufibacter immobilis]|uniref:RNA polymerase sigma factor n=1 Tax=Rufibacter immobilis TaxID=1348778 RepID=A0A3M9N2C9_9BACT|nr:RNA polymerase sigma factor [Rufibacter immobilis]RNI31886.1 RNA polymerase sigma factor [Rufibacter immobilis]